MEIIHPSVGTNKVENNIEERPSVVTTASSPGQQHHTGPVVDSLPKHVGEYQTSVVNSVHVVDSLPEHFGECQTLVVNQGPESPTLDGQGDNDPMTTELPNSCDPSKVEIFGAISENFKERPDFEFEMLSKPSFCTPMTSEYLSVEELAGGVSYSPMETDRINKLKVSQLGASRQGINRALAPRKGIMKKQSRFCKGICLCLECASFRVHAERAYEFSRRQMSDANEVIERLVKELSCLRNVMENSVVPMTESTGSYTVLQADQVNPFEIYYLFLYHLV